MDNNNLYKIFNNTDCISTEVMIAYQENKLSEMEKNSVEKHLSSCNMCRDEFEGLALIPIKSSISDTVLGLNSKVDNMLAKTNKRIPFLMPINLLAAIILFIIGFAWYAAYYIKIFKNNQEQIAEAVDENLSKSDGEILILQPESELSESERNLKILKTFGQNKSGLIKENDKEESINDEYNENQYITAENNANVNSEAIITDENKNEKRRIAVAGIEVNISDKDKVKEKEILDDDIIAKDESKKALDNVETEISTLANRSKKTPNNAFGDGVTAYQNGQYAEAIRIFDNIKSSHKPTGDVYYYIAICFEKSGSYTDAISNYNKVLKDKKSTYYQESLWNKSNLLLKSGKTDQAKKNFKQLSELNGVYSERAKNLLDSLNIQ